MPVRFHVPDLDPGDPVVTLPDAEAHHLTKVLRLGVGAAVRVFDGRGGEWGAEVVEARGHHARLRLGDVAMPAAEPRVPLTLAVAVLKGDKFDDVVRDAVMLGVRAIQPFVSAHTDVSHDAARARSASGRWARIAISSTKQCGRAVLPAVHELATIDDVLASRAGEGFVLAEPGAGSTSVRLADLSAEPPPTSATLVVGPEGGWHDDELSMAARAGWRVLRLGARTLRADAAPLVGLTALMAVWGEL